MRPLPHLFNLTFLFVLNILSDSFWMMGVTGIAAVLYGTYVMAHVTIRDERKSVSKAARTTVLGYVLAIIVLNYFLHLSAKNEEGRMESFADPTSPYGGVEHYMDDLKARLFVRLGPPEKTDE